MKNAIDWLLDGDVSVQYMTRRLLLNDESKAMTELQRRIETEGFGAALLACRNPNGHWGAWFYQPKWTSTHYTLTELKNLYMPQSCAPCREMVKRAFDECLLDNGGINFAKTMVQSDVCVDGMIMDYAAWFCPDEKRIERLLDFILSTQMQDGGFGWNLTEGKSDPHTTVCVLEGFLSYKTAGFTYRCEDIARAENRAAENLLSNSLFMEVDKRFAKLSYPYRYRYDLLRLLEYFSGAGTTYDARLRPALLWLEGKRKADGLWHLENEHPGNVHVVMEQKNEPSRFITLRALLILEYYREPLKKWLQ